MYYTYLWLREDGSPYYVGKGKNKRAYQSKDHNVRMPRSHARILVQFWESEEKAFEMEKWWIAFYGRKDIGTGILRNLTEGGDGPSGWIPSEQTKSKIREARKHQIFTEETKKLLKESRARRVFTKEMRHNMSIAMKIAKQGLWKHGTINGYRRHKCRCELCKKAASTHAKGYKLKHQEK